MKSNFNFVELLTEEQRLDLLWQVINGCAAITVNMKPDELKAYCVATAKLKEILQVGS